MKLNNVKTIYIIILMVFLAGCQGNVKNKTNLNGTYERNCGSMSYGTEGYLFKVVNDSLVEFYESDGYDLDKDLREEYNENKPVSLKWKIWKDVHGETIRGKLILIDDNRVVLKNNNCESCLDTFTIQTGGSLYREEKRTLSDEMANPNELECHYKILYIKK